MCRRGGNREGGSFLRRRCGFWRRLRQSGLRRRRRIVPRRRRIRSRPVRRRSSLRHRLLFTIQRRRRSSGSRKGTRGQLCLKHVQALGQSLERQIALGTRKTREGDLEHQTRIGSIAHLDSGIIQHGKNARKAIGRLEARRLLAQGGNVLWGAIKKFGSGTRHARRVDITHVRDKIACNLQQVVSLFDLRANQSKERRNIACGDTLRKLRENRARSLAQKGASIAHSHSTVAKNRKLLQGGKSIAHAAAGMAGNDLQSFFVALKALLLTHVM